MSPNGTRTKPPTNGSNPACTFLLPVADNAAWQAELDAIKGQPRCIPIFREVTGNGNNATYTIVKFVGIRIMAVKLTGSMSNKKVTIQPADVQCPGMIPGTGTSKADFVYSGVWLAR